MYEFVVNKAHYSIFTNEKTEKNTIRTDLHKKEMYKLFLYVIILLLFSICRDRRYGDVGETDEEDVSGEGYIWFWKIYKTT